MSVAALVHHAIALEASHTWGPTCGGTNARICSTVGYVHVNVYHGKAKVRARD